MIETDEGFRLTSGKEFYANGGILGLSPTSLDLCEGYDGIVEMVGPNEKPYPDAEVVFTDAERQEIADYMISLWRAWAKPR